MNIPVILFALASAGYCASTIHAAPAPHTYSLDCTFNEPLHLIRRLVDHAVAQLPEIPIPIAIVVATTESAPFLAHTSITHTHNLDPKVTKIIGPITEPFVALIVFPANFMQLSYGAKKACILHEVYHLVQFCPTTWTFNAVEPILHPKGADQEADCWAMRHLHCSGCAREFSKTRNIQDDIYTSQAEALALAKTYSQSQLCSYHRALKKHMSHRAVIKQIARGKLEP